MALPADVPTASAEDWQLQLGTISTFPRSGTPDFDASTATFGPYANEGNDGDDQNNVVRANDAVIYAWSITGSNIDDDADTVTTLPAVTFEQTITPNAPLGVDDIEIESLSAAECPGAGTGIQYDVPVGSITITCDTGNYNTGDQTSVSVRVRPKSSALNGDSFTSTQRVYATDGEDDPTETAFDLNTTDQGDTIYITSRPEWNLTKHGFFNQDPVVAYDPDGAGPLPAEDGIFTYAVMQISSDRPFGNEALAGPITVHDELTLTDNSGSNTPYSGRYYPVGCTENPSRWPGVVYGYNGGSFGIPGAQNSCSASIVRDGDDTSGFSFTFPEIDFDPLTYPVSYSQSGSLTSGPFYVASVRIQYFIPKATIDASPSGDNTAQLFNAVGDFDPAGVSGTTSNFGAGFEPGYCTAAENGLPGGECDPNSVADPSSDNVVGPTAVRYTPSGIGGTPKKDTNRMMTSDFKDYVEFLPGQANAKSADGLVEPGMYWMHRIYTKSSAETAQRGYVCDVFDNTTARLADLSNVTSPPVAAGTYGALPVLYGLDPAENVIEYGTVDLSSLDPIASYNGSTSRYEGDWSVLTDLVHDGCAEDDFTTWYTDPTLVPGGIDAVNTMRVRPADGTVRNVPADQYLLLAFALQSRETFNGGPHDGASIPDGTVIANQMNRKFDEDVDNGLAAVDYHTQSFGPSPLVYAETGERVTVSRASLAVLKRTLQDVDTGYTDGIGDPILSGAGSTYDVTGSGVAGDYVVWEMSPTITSELGGSSELQNVTLTDVLPVGVAYDPTCTAAIPGGTPASVLPDTPGAGETTLTWALGARSAGDDLGDFTICTVTDDFAANGSSFVNNVTFSADGLTPATDEHTITLVQASKTKVQKTVDATRDLLDDDQVWTITMRNFSSVVNPETPSMLEVFPYIGDATSINGGQRAPASAFSGTNQLSVLPVATFLDGTTPAPGTYWYTADAPATIDHDPDGNVAGNLTNWCSTSDGGTTWAFVNGPGSVADCPAGLSTVSAFLYTSTADLAGSSDPVFSGIAISFTLQADGNAPGDIYTNRFTGDTPTFPAAQFLRSNIVTVTTVGFELGDWVWNDTNGNGIWDATEAPVPDGVTVELYDDSDTLIATQQTADGRYKFTGLRGGEYYVQIPAAEFQVGGTLAGWDVTPSAPETGDGDINDTGGHNGSSAAGVAVDGLRSNLVLLSAHTDGNDILRGDEPTGDNTHGLTAGDDDFTNFTVDLAVVAPPSIDIDKQVRENGTDDPFVELVEVPFLGDAEWQITVTNTGLVDLTDVEVTDALESACDFTYTDTGGVLSPGESFQYTCVSDDLEVGFVNTAEVIGTPPIGSDVDDEDPAEVEVGEDPTVVTTTTTPATTTTTPSTTTTLPPPTGLLPTTGGNLAQMLGIGLLCIATGALVLVRRRPLRVR